jgi:hypothetical protein
MSPAIEATLDKGIVADFAENAGSETLRVPPITASIDLH